MKKIKLRVGGKYRMKDYPGEYEYILITGMERDLGIDDGKCYYNDKTNGIDQYHGVIIYKSSLSGLTRMPDLLVWGENGEWDGAFLEDCNAIIEEIL